MGNIVVRLHLSIRTKPQKRECLNIGLQQYLMELLLEWAYHAMVNCVKWKVLI